MGSVSVSVDVESTPLMSNPKGSCKSKRSGLKVTLPVTPVTPTGSPMSSASSSPRSRSPSVYNDESVDTTVFEVHEWGSNRWIRVEVIEPVTITAKNFLHLSTSFTTYLIRIETNHYAFSLPVSEVRRRYSEFSWVRTKLTHHHPNKVVPPVPPKKFFHITKFNSTIINERRFGLGKFLQRVFRSSVLLSDAALHLFLQTDLSVAEMEGKLNEELPLSPNSFPLTSTSRSVSTSVDKHPITYKRPYLLRSVSCSSGSGCGDVDGNSNGSGDDGSGRSSPSGSDGEGKVKDFCDVSSSEEFDIDVCA